MKEHEEEAIRDIVLPSANNIFTAAFTAAKAANSSLNENLFADLKGFLQLIVSYIVRGQARTASVTKATFTLMSRTNFGSLFKQLLSADEQALFKTMVGNPARPADNPILTELEPPINADRATFGRPLLTLTRSTRFFSLQVGPEERTFGPSIYKWLLNITRGTDLLSGEQKGISDAMSAKRVLTKLGDKDYRRAQFEVRATSSHGAHIDPSSGEFILGNDRPRVEWVSFAMEIFDAARRRAADTPDDPTTPKVNESSKTGLTD
jgi:hypothetical protein